MPNRTPNPAFQYITAEIRSVSDDGAGLSGYAAHFGNVDSYGTAMKRGAFRKTLKERGDRIPVLWNHWSDAPIGKPTELKEDRTGLYFDAVISEGTNQGRDVMTLLRDGVPLGMSFGFETIKSRPIEAGDDVDFATAPDFYKGKEGREYVRLIEEVRLWEISVVTFPANELATIDNVRAATQMDALSTLLEDLRSGELKPEDTRWAQLQALVAVWDERNEPEPPHSTPLADEQARRKRDIEIALAYGRSLMGVQA
jgi:HK97 family phage prohead protease